MIKIFGSTDKDFTSNGDVVLQPLRAKVHKEDNGDYYLDFVAGLEHSDYLVAGNLIVVSTPQGDQAFRISNPEKNKSKITIKAWHVFYDSENYLIADSDVVEKNCAQALAQFNGSTEPRSEFSTSSDVTVVNSYRSTRESLYEAITVILEQWGGHLIRDNFSIRIQASIGTDNGVTVQYKKNLKDITCEEDWSDVVTKLLPVGKNGVMLNTINPSASIYVTSQTQYAIPYVKSVTFPQDNINQDDYDDEDEFTEALVADLRRVSQAYVNANCVPKVNYTLKANLEKITDIGDVVEVKDSRLGIDIMTSVIAFEYDCILEKYTEIEFGNFKQKLSGLVSSISSSINSDVTEQVSSATVAIRNDVDRISEDVTNTLQNGHVIYDGEKILVVDLLPKESAQNVIKLDNTGLSFSQTGINGVFKTVLGIDNTLNLQNTTVVKESAVCSVASGWDLYESGENPTVIKQGNVVCFDGQFKPTSIVTLGTTDVLICTIPQGFRPSKKVNVLCQGSGTSFFLASIFTTGQVRISRLRNVANNNDQYTDGTPSMWFPISATWIT